VMRHSVRLDDDDAATWEDKEARPYDTPIKDLELPVQQAQELLKHKLGSFNLLVCSPFRRCLETMAIVVASLLDSSTTAPPLRVDKTFGEKMHSVRSLQAQEWGTRRPADGVVEYLREDEQSNILSSKSGGKLSVIEAQDGVMPPPDEEARDGTQRYIDHLRAIRDTKCQAGEKVLVVAHGDTVDAAVRAFTDETVYIAEECCWVAFSFGEGGVATRVASNRIESMVM